MTDTPASDEQAREAAFAREVDRLRKEAVPGQSGRLRDLFDYLAERGHEAEPATQGEISLGAFGQPDPEADDATVRVYVHRLRKRLEEHYAAHPAEAERLEIPAGVYALRLADAPRSDTETGPVEEPEPAPAASRVRRYWPVALLAALVAAFLAGFLVQRPAGVSSNAFWDPFLESERPALVVLGDYYIYGEIDPVRPDQGRLIRDFRVDSPEDLERMQDLEPERYGNAEDVGLNYLPFSAAYGLQEIVPLLEANGKEVSVIAASELEPDMFNYFDVVYVGLFSGMGLLEEQNFMGSGFELGDSYDELIDPESGETYVSDEARTLASPAYYRDYGYLSRYSAPGGALVGVVGASRDTGLRGVSPIVTAADLPERIRDVAGGQAGFEALFEITGQQGADLSERLLVARERP